MSSFISKFGAVFFDFECCEFAKFHFELQLFSHFWNMNVAFFTGRLVKPFNGLLPFFIFLACYLISFLYKGMLLPSFVIEANDQPSVFFFCFQDFFFFFKFILISLYLFASFLVIFLIFFFYVLWDLFPDKIFFVACFYFAAQFPWSLGFDIKLYTGVHDALMLSLALVFKAILAFVLAIKLLQHLPLQYGHINRLYHEVLLALVLAMKQY